MAILQSQFSRNQWQVRKVVLDDMQPLADFNNDANNFYYHEGEITNWEDEYQANPPGNDGPRNL